MLSYYINWFRQNILIYIQIALPDSIIYSVHYDDYVGELEIELNEFNAWAKSQPNVYENIFAAAVRWRIEEGERQVELGSWAYRPNGRFSDFQYHLVPIRNKRGDIELYCHKEHNPIRHPLKHLKSENFWGPEGVRFANSLDYNR
jgi:hypothetical protein